MATVAAAVRQEPVLLRRSTRRRWRLRLVAGGVERYRSEGCDWVKDENDNDGVDDGGQERMEGHSRQPVPKRNDEQASKQYGHLPRTTLAFS